jgi:hypothetical protein
MNNRHFMSNKKQSNQVGRCESSKQRGVLEEGSPLTLCGATEDVCIKFTRGESQSALLGKVNSFEASESKGTHNLYVTAILYDRIVNDIGAQIILVKGHFYKYSI